MRILCSLIFALLIQEMSCIIQVAPTWLTSPFVQAGSKKIIDITGSTPLSNSTATTIIPFTTAFTTAPHLAYGISGYEADNSMRGQIFELTRTTTALASLSLRIQISGRTELWVVQVRYIAINKSFTYHLNTFEDVPINHNSGVLSNITTLSMTTNIYTNTINYSAQSATSGSNYTVFSSPLTNNKILLFLTTLNLAGSQEGDNGAPPIYPLNLTINAVATSTTTYTITCTFSIYATISKLHLSILAFDQVNIETSGQYMVISDKICHPKEGGVYNFPAEFLTNFMVGFIDFVSSRTKSTMHFVTNYGTFNGSYGAQMPLSVPRDSGDRTLTLFCFNVFYMKAWLCPNDTFLNTSINLCTSCTILNCLTCSTLTVCLLCNESNGYFLNATTGQCDTCSITGCTNCSSPTVCLSCNHTQNYILSNQSCLLCDQSLNFFADPSAEMCDQCTIPNCLNCSSLTACQKCNNTASYYLNPSHTCSFCDWASNHLIDPVTFDCDVCTLPECTNCSTLTTCQECNETNNYFLGNDSLCHLCTPTNCVTCSNLTACAVCDVAAGFALNPTTLLCEVCNLTGCVNCSNTATCVECNLTANFVLQSTTCLQCTAPTTFVNVTSSQCEPCSVANCSICATLCTCSVCNYNNSYYLLSNLTCGYCDPALNNFINSTYQCEACSLPNCLTCASLTSCTLCNETAQYFTNSSDTSTCYVCSIPNCVDCLNLTTCDVCNASAGYIVNPSTGLCQLCPSGLFPNTTSRQCENCTLSDCSTCATLSTCSVCDYNNSYYLLSNLTCGYCDPGANTFINSTHQCEACTLPNCLSCSSLTSCSLCNETAQYFTNSSDSTTCYACSIPDCVDCLNLTTCDVCDASTGHIANPSTGLCELCPSGLFPNVTSRQCENCTLSDCSTCASLSSCSICDYNNSYYLLSNLTCGYCDPALNTFINSTYQCEACSLPNCLTCASLTSCSLCNETAQYFTNSSDNNLCYLCSPTNCIDCYNLTTCNICNITGGYVLNSSTGLCQLCPSGLFPNVTSSQCEPCAVQNCSVCSALTTCQTCDYNNSFYLLGNSTCGLCNSTLNYFINMTSGTYNCEACALSNCLTCSSLTSCSLCNETAQYFTNSSDNNLCYLCSPTNCIDCYNLTTCNICNITAGYVLNSSSGLCQLCPAGLFPNTTSRQCEPCAVPHCSTCSALTTCSICDTNSSYYLHHGTCNFCNPANNRFIDSHLDCQTCHLSHCINCSSLTTCSVCDASDNYFLNTSDNRCYLCTLPNCNQCVNFTACAVCDGHHDYFLNSSTGLCQLCSLLGCEHCSSLTVCRQCDTGYGFDYTSPNMSLCGTCNVSCICDGYGLPWNAASQTCTPVCGDGLVRLGEECDDGNTNSYDGCSSSCVVEEYYVCSGEPTVCNETMFIESEFVAIEKEGCNGFKATVRTPRFTLSQISGNIHILNKNVTISRITENDTLIEVHAEYTRDIANETIQLLFAPGETLNISYNPTTPALFYTPEECNVSDQVETMLQAAEIISYAILILSLLSCKIVGLELFGVLQLSYFTLSSHSFLNVYLAPLTKFRTFNGLNLGITSETSQVPENYSKMGVAGTFINNCNVMLFVLFGELVVALILYIVSKVSRKQKLEKLALRLLKQGFVTLVLFNIFNISFSAGVHWKYASPTDDGYVISSLILYGTLAAMVVAVAAMELTSREDYGEFKKKFKNVWICQLYVPLTVVYRMVLGFYSAVKSDYDEGTLIILGFAIAFMLYTIINLPFTNVFQNYRCSLIHLTMLYTLLTTNYYRSMKSTTPIEVKGRIYGPAIIELILMVNCIAVSFLVLAYEIYQIIKEWRNQKKISNKATRPRHPTEQSFQTL